MRRRDLLKTGALLAGASSLMRPQMWADVPDHLWEGYPFGSPQVTNRLDQGPFGIDQDEGWFTIFATQPSREHIRNFGGGLVGYTWEENGPALKCSVAGKPWNKASRKWRLCHLWTCCTSAAIGAMCRQGPAS